MFFVVFLFITEYNAFVESVLPKQPETVRWSRDLYARMGKLGWFEGKRTELIDGSIYDVPPCSAAHTASAKVVFQAICALVPANYFVGFQNPLNLSAISEPRPDVSVLLGAPSDHLNTLPQRPSLIIEIADASFEFDRTVKAKLYAMMAIPEYWILDLNGRKLTVKRGPSSNALGPDKAGYLDVSVHGANSSISPLFAAQKPLAVASLLP
jgi:Uma2 family endonuclease